MAAKKKQPKPLQRLENIIESHERYIGDVRQKIARVEDSHERHIGNALQKLGRFEEELNKLDCGAATAIGDLKTTSFNAVQDLRNIVGEPLPGEENHSLKIEYIESDIRSLNRWVNYLVVMTVILAVSHQGLRNHIARICKAIGPH